MKCRQFLSFIVLAAIPGIVHAQAWSGILDATRAIDWSTAGAGAIPARTTMCTTLGTPGKTPSFVQSVTVAQINSALSSCPSGQTVLLNPGTYNSNGSTINIPSNITLRGSGPSQTVIAATGSGGRAVVQFGNGTSPTAATNTTITGGNLKGSTAITVGSAANISVGKLLTITQSDLNYMTQQGDNGDCSWCSGGIGGNSGQTVLVTGVNGNTITISDPLYTDYTNSPLAFPYTVGCAAAGLEALKISDFNNGYSPNISFSGVIYSWVKNVESDFADGAHLYLSWSLHNTVRDSFFHDGFSHGPGTTDDQVGLQYKSSANLLENNIFWRQHISVMLEWGASGNVIAYNYSTGNYHDQAFAWMISDIDFHGAHPMMNLFEGNIGVHFQPDSTWGSSSHSTIFRNYSTGSNAYIPPANARGALQTGSPTQETANSIAYSMDHDTQFNNMVGVIHGSNFLVNNQGAPNKLVAPASGGGGPAGIAVGYLSASTSSTSPTSADATMFYHGVYNFTDGSFQWANGVTQTLPASFYLSAKPTWWGGIGWPAIGPDVTGGSISDSTTRGHVNAIPALNCFNISTSNGTTNAGAFDANTCYKVTSTSIAPPVITSAVVQ